MRALHLIDPATPGGGACTLQLLAEVVTRTRSIEHEVILIGSVAHRALAERCGVQPIGHLCPPRFVPTGGRRALRRLIEQRERALGRYDLIHAWDAHAAMLATLAAPHRKRLAWINVGPVNNFHTQLLNYLLEHHPMPILTASSAVYREYRSMGINATALDVLPPAVHVPDGETPDRPQPVYMCDRMTLRERWGVDETTFVVGLLSEPVNWADARHALNAVMRLALTGRDVRLLLHHTATGRIEALSTARQLGCDDVLIVDDEVAEPWRIVNGLDASLLIGGDLNVMNLRDAGSPFSLLFGGGRRVRPMPGVMPLLWSMSAGVPVVAEASDAVRDIVDDQISGLLVKQNDVNAAVDRLMRLYDDPTVGGRIGSAGKLLVQNRFHISSFCVRLRAVYEQIARNRPIHVEDPFDDGRVEIKRAVPTAGIA